MPFDWDPDKSLSNLVKHGIDFDDAIGVFEDPHAVITNVTKPEHGETRLKVIGAVDNRIIAVIYTVRDGSRRIISARRSRRNERREYLGEGETAR